MPRSPVVGVSGPLGYLETVVLHLVVVVLGPLLFVTSLPAQMEVEEGDEKTDEDDGAVGIGADVCKLS